MAVNILYERIINNDTKYVEMSCLSTDTKPTAGIAHGSLSHEVDTATISAFNATSGQWVQQVELGGGATSASVGG